MYILKPWERIRKFFNGGDSMDPIKVMVVDDSAFMRKIIGDMISQHEGMEVVAKARNGVEALKKLEDIQPDVITLDVEMPLMDGLTTLKTINKQYNIPVIMLSGLTARGSRITIESLEAGAFDFIQKPSGMISFDIREIEDELIRKIRSVSYLRKKIKEFKESSKLEVQSNKSFIDLSSKAFEAIAIGASTGGPKALFEIINKLHPQKSFPIFIVQHMPSGFTTSFAERLNNYCSLRVKEAEDGEMIEKGYVYIAPGDYHMTIHEKHISLNKKDKLWGVRPAVDYLFESAASVYKDKLLAFILTGMGKDGTNGMKAIKRWNGINIAQDKESSVIFGMPNHAIASGVVDKILSLEEISIQINEVIKRC